jgi:hypothetical protein
MLWLKSCPQCKGDSYQDRDLTITMLPVSSYLVSRWGEDRGIGNENFHQKLLDEQCQAFGRPLGTAGRASPD